MAIFSRRAIQQMIDENASFLSKHQLEQHVSKLNRNDFQSLDVEWEVAILNAFSKMGSVTHEPSLPGTAKGTAKLDLLFVPFSDPTVQFVAEVTMVSDEGFEENIPRLAFEIELHKRIRKAGLRLNCFNHRIEAFPRKSPGDSVRLMLPKRAEFHKEIFNDAFKSFLQQIQRSPNESRRHHISSDKTNILITYNPKQTASMSTHLSYTQAWSKIKNPVFNALNNKARNQFKRVTYAGPKGIIMCDGSCDLFSDLPRSSFHPDYNLTDIIKEFFRQNSSIDFVLLVSSIWNKSYYPSFNKDWVRVIQVKIFGNTSFPSLSQALKKSLLELERQFPQPVNIASGARESMRRGFDEIKANSTNVRGVREMGHRHIKVSARDVLRILAGEIKPEEIFQLGNFNTTPNPEHNYFRKFLDQRLRIVGVSLEESPYDDTELIIEFDGPDPAVSPFANPKANSSE